MTAQSEPVDTATLTETDRRAVRQVLGQMPYLPAVLTHRSRMEPDTVAQLVVLLAELATVLTTEGMRQTELESAHRQLRADLSAFRRVLGTAPPE